MCVTAIIQARMTSSRLPGKIVMEVLGKPLLAYMVERVKEAGLVGKIVIATTANKEDDVVADLAVGMNVGLYRGSEHNVLKRFYLAAERFADDIVMRLTGDNPLVDPDLIDALVRLRNRGNFDYVSNCLEPTFPDGLDAEVFTLSALENTYTNAKLPSDLEHVTRYIYQRPNQFKLGDLKYEKDLSHLRWTVDEAEDFEFVRQIIERIYPKNPSFRMKDILALLNEYPELTEINCRYQRNEGLIPSLIKDKEIFNGKKHQYDGR